MKHHPQYYSLTEYDSTFKTHLLRKCVSMTSYNVHIQSQQCSPEVCLIFKKHKPWCQKVLKANFLKLIERLRHTVQCTGIIRVIKIYMYIHVVVTSSLARGRSLNFYQVPTPLPIQLSQRLSQDFFLICLVPCFIDLICSHFYTVSYNFRV